jgi:hypothetical protein
MNAVTESHPDISLQTEWSPSVAALPYLTLRSLNPPSWPRRAASAVGILPLTEPAQPTPGIEDFLAQLPTGSWSIARDTARGLAMIVHAAKPRLVLEFGSGTSTAVFARLCAQRGGDARVISVEENARYADRTRELLASFGLSDWATVIHAPVRRRRIDGWVGFGYDLDGTDIARTVGHDRVDFIFIDGPATWLRRRGDARYGTLLTARTLAAESALFVVDDSFRPRDLAILHRWQALPHVQIRGVVPIGRGLGLGVLQGPRRRPA